MIGRRGQVPDHAVAAVVDKAQTVFCLVQPRRRRLGEQFRGPDPILFYALAEIVMVAKVAHGLGIAQIHGAAEQIGGRGEVPLNAAPPYMKLAQIAHRLGIFLRRRPPIPSRRRCCIPCNSLA